jgi:hypothetical protein
LVLSTSVAFLLESNIWYKLKGKAERCLHQKAIEYSYNSNQTQIAVDHNSQSTGCVCINWDQEICRISRLLELLRVSPICYLTTLWSLNSRVCNWLFAKGVVVTLLTREPVCLHPSWVSWSS